METYAVVDWICERMDALETAEDPQFCLVSSARKVGSPRDLSAMLLEEFGISSIDFPIFGEQHHEGGMMKPAFSYKTLKSALRARGGWTCPMVTFIGVGDVAMRVFRQLTGVALEGKCPHYCMWHRVKASGEAWRRVQQVLERVCNSANSDLRARVRKVARRHAAQKVSAEFKHFFRFHRSSSDHNTNHRQAITDPSPETRSAQSSNMKRLRRDSVFENNRRAGVKESVALSQSSSGRMNARHAQRREAAGKKKFHPLGADGVEAVAPANCPWCVTLHCLPRASTKTTDSCARRVA